MSELATVIEAICGSPVSRSDRFPGGDISGAAHVELADGRTVVAKNGPVVDVEAGMLRELESACTPSPEVLGMQDQVLVMEHLPSSGSLTDAWESLAEALHGLRDLTGGHYGWHQDYALRHVIVDNTNCSNWAEFWAEQRLRCHVPYLDSTLGSRVSLLADAMPDILPSNPPAVFVHGDLWGGNILVDGGKISGLIDPCALYGDAEVDAASLTVFDNPPGRFFDALELDDGWRERQPVYRLWMWLLHVRLFGDSYRPAVERDLDALGF